MSAIIDVLFLAADPLAPGQPMPLRLGEEARDIQNAIQLGSERDQLRFHSVWALRTGDLQAALLRYRPQVVHFAGHGDRSRGIFLEDDDGRPKAVSREALASLFEVLGGSVRVVLLNACDSLVTADALSGAVDYCIGMNSLVSDQAAILFSTAFYQALAFGESVEDAFGWGVARMRLEGSPEFTLPVLRVRDGADRGPIAPPEDQDAPEEETHYLRTLVSRLDTLDLFGVGDAGASLGAGRKRISDIFTQPNLTLTRAPGQTVADALRAGDGAGPAADAPGRRVGVQAVEAFAAAKRLVVLGDPGGGKSVLASHLAVQLALRALGEAGTFIPGWSDDTRPLPVVVLLREMAEWLAGRGASGPGQAGWVWDYLAHLLGEWGCVGAFPALGAAIHKGRAAVFFDGLDELVESKENPWRTRIAHAVREFAAPLQARVLVTCRKYAYAPGEPWYLADADFPVVELGRFQLGQIRTFALQWYLSEGRQRGWSAEEGRRRGLQLYEQIRASPQLRDLAGSPLLLTLMARIHRAEQALPDDRAQLYDRAIDLLLAEWENRKGEGWRAEGTRMVARLGVPTARLRAALAGLACDAHTASARAEGRVEGTASLHRYDLLECLKELAGGLDPAVEFIEYIRVRAGLLVERDDGTYAFPHRTFQEYLAATHLLARGDFAEALVEQLRGDFTWWREVFFLAAATLAAEPERLAALADAVLVEVEDAPLREVLVQAAASVALAMAGAAFSQAAGRVKRYARLASRMRRVLAPAMAAEAELSAAVRAEAAFALSRLGDPRDEVRCVEAMAFHRVPAGPFWMGTPADDPAAYPEELPLHRQEVPYDYWIGRYPVTVAQFRAFACAEGRAPGSPDPHGADGHP
ncbi:MAG TPA: SUMF1/EgtB/PvdO family nonheme iron enzyme, partial [Longimicrobium sp.]|nr:SUMF1/EgtB/PvdO family nonheme iron enzyme [Longimicrobium sp.]